MIYSIFNWLENLAFTWSKKSLKTFQKCRFKMFSYKKEKKKEKKRRETDKLASPICHTTKPQSKVDPSKKTGHLGQIDQSQGKKHKKISDTSKNHLIFPRLHFNFFNFQLLSIPFFFFYFSSSETNSLNNL